MVGTGAAGATVSVPGAWVEVEVEVEDAVRERDERSLVFTLADVPRRAAAGGLSAPVLAGGQRI